MIFSRITSTVVSFRLSKPFEGCNAGITPDPLTVSALNGRQTADSAKKSKSAYFAPAVGHQASA